MALSHRDPAVPGPLDDLIDPGGSVPRGMSRPDLGLVQATEVFADLSLADPAIATAAGWLAHQQADARRSTVVVGADLLRRWVDEPLADIADVVTSQRGRAGLLEVRRHLHDDLRGAAVVTAPLHPTVALGRWWFAPTLDEVVQVDGWQEVAVGPLELDGVLLVAAARALAADDMTVVSALGEVLADGWMPAEEAALAPLWGANRGLRPSTLVVLALLHAWDRRDLDSVPGTLDRRLDRDVEELFEHLAPR